MMNDEYPQDLPWTDPIEDEELTFRIAQENRASFGLPVPVGLIDRLAAGRISVGAFIAYANALLEEELERTDENEEVIDELLASNLVSHDGREFTLNPPTLWS